MNKNNYSFSNKIVNEKNNMFSGSNKILKDGGFLIVVDNKDT